MTTDEKRAIAAIPQAEREAIFDLAYEALCGRNSDARGLAEAVLRLRGALEAAEGEVRRLRDELAGTKATRNVWATCAHEQRARAERLELAIREAPHLGACICYVLGNATRCDCGVEEWKAAALSPEVRDGE